MKNHKEQTRNIITIATSKKLYIDMAVNLARSFIWWHPGSTINFYIVTDHADLIPEDVINKIKTIVIKPGELGEGFSSKLHLDHLAPEGQTLFIDSDCLIFGNLDEVFEKFKGKSVSVLGNYASEGEWFGNIKKICQDFNIPRIPKFNGGIYYLEKGETADKVYQLARDLEKRYDEIGFQRLRNRPNDEVIMALAMQLTGMEPFIDDGTVMSDPQACQGGYELHILSGKRWMLNPPEPNPLHQNWYPFERVEPLIVHFLGTYTEFYPYKREVYLLEKALTNELNAFVRIKAKITIEYPSRFVKTFKNAFRSAYRQLFGTRKIKTSNRI
jgi:hypothetical protein